MWIVKLALRRPYTFVVVALLLLIIGPLVIFRTSTDIFPNIDIPVVASDVALAVAEPLLKVIPPKLVLRERSTVWEIGLPAVSSILNLTVETSGKVALPVPFRVMLAGVAETNWMEPAFGGVTFKVPIAETPVITLAVMVSVLPQPLSR